MRSVLSCICTLLLPAALIAQDSQAKPEITLEVRFLSVPAERLRDYQLVAPPRRDITETPKPPLPSFDEVTSPNQDVPLLSVKSQIETLPIGYVQTLSPQKMTQLITTAQGDPRSNIVFAPKVTTFSGDEVNICDEVQRPCVIGLPSQNGPQGTITVLGEGASLRIRPELAPTGQIKLAARIRLRAIDDIQIIQLEGQAVQDPQVSETTLELLATVNQQETLVIWCTQPQPAQPAPKGPLLSSFFGGTKPTKPQLLITLTPIVVQPQPAAAQ